ncbi:hypothetical protein RRG08_041777 [Elysia crispata]|uniref:Uncharacterized protein n=1 Tax=Elysia crispata TaxID=231223 RepID=A0AAE1D0H4_9GAST|nr:hypothetical protein RRG08_041777 [Elysia crispata]
MEHQLEDHISKLKQLCRLCLKRDQRAKGVKPRAVTDFQKDILITLHKIGKVVPCSIEEDNDEGDDSGLQHPDLFIIRESGLTEETLERKVLLLENTNVYSEVDRLHSDYSATASCEDSNTQMLMRLAQALEAGESDINDGASYSEDSNRQPVMSINQPLSFNVHSRIQPQPLAQSTPRKSHTQTDSATSPLKTPSKNKTFTDSSASPLLKGNVLSMHEITKKDSMHKPLTYEEEKLVKHLIKRKINTPEDKDTVRLMTKGQPLVLQKLVVARKPSSKVNSPLRRKRAKQLEKTRQLVSRKTESEFLLQKASELKRMQPKAKRKLNSMLGLMRREFSAQETLAMKETMNITYHQLRLQTRFLKTIGTHLPNEHAIRAVHKNISAGNIDIKLKAFEDSKSVRHHKLLEQDAINIDEERARLAGEIRTYEKYGQHWEEAMPLKEDKQHLKTCFLLHREDTEKRKPRLEGL